MRLSTALVIASFASSPVALAQSTLLESVQQNPEEARELCLQFKALNEKGVSASSNESIKQVAKQKNLSSIDAEILSTYVIGLNCPNVR